MTMTTHEYLPKNLPQIIWLDGEFINLDTALISPLTHGLHYSGAVFEGEQAYDYKIFKLTEHTNRLLNSAKVMQLNSPFTFDEIYQASNELLKRNNLPDAYIRPLIWRGCESMNLVNRDLKVHCMIAAKAVSPRINSGYHINIANWRKAAPNSMPPQVKSSTHYGMMITIKEEASNLGFDDSLILDYLGNIAECTTTNIFFVKNNKLFTPKADNFLRGITRQTVIEIANDNQIPVQEEILHLEDIKDFGSCFTTGTAAEIQNIASIEINGEKIIFTDHKLANFLAQEYQKLVRR